MFDLTQPRPLQAAADPLRPPGLAFTTRLIGRLMSFGYRLTGRDRYDDFRLERVLELPFLVMPSVFNPKLPRTGAFLAAQLDDRLIAPDAQVLDMGTGSGVCAVHAARRARRVVAVDINPAAVRCAAVNAALNGVEQRVEARHGDLFAPVAGERFDLILFNPPFLRGQPRDDRDRAWRSVDVAERFAAGLADHLAPGGAALVVLSSFGGATAFVEEFRRQRLAITVFAARRFLTERLAVLKLEPPPRSAP
ncbi:MAG TPA: HemK2/MTQ2 family protein methyltransferase [Steroidobacteraceae bacterium]|nr:HemK2/MTQ2 family protein methyltransferase [Steroidobacteraceae bacterium]